VLVAVDIVVGVRDDVVVAVNVCVGMEVAMNVTLGTLVTVGVTVDVAVGVLEGVLLGVVVDVAVTVGPDWMLTTSCGGAAPSRDEKVTPSFPSAINVKV
jgi:hypothetical protein